MARYTKKEIEILYPSLSKDSIKKLINAKASSSEDDVRSLYGSRLDEVNKVLPISTVTGHADDFVSRFFRSISDEERELLGKFIVQKPSITSPSQISDEDLAALLPSRYSQDFADADKYRGAIISYLNSVRSENSSNIAPASADVSASDDASA